MMWFMANRARYLIALALTMALGVPASAQDLRKGAAPIGDPYAAHAIVAQHGMVVAQEKNRGKHRRRCA